MDKKVKSRHLTIYLIKKGINDPQKILEKYAELKRIFIEKDGVSIGELYIKPSVITTPSWVSLFKDVISEQKMESKSSSTSAVLLVKASKRNFAITFGRGKNLLEPSCYEERFGLLVTLNSIKSNRIRSIDKKTFDAISRHTREQASREGTPIDFGLDVEQDLLRAVTGTPEDETLGSRLTGIDALNVSVRVELAGIPDLLKKYYKKNKENNYKENFAWVDHISEIKSLKKIEELNEKLLESIKANDFEQLWLAIPEIIDWSYVGGFRYSSSIKKEKYDDIHITTFLNSLPDSFDLNIEALKKKKAYCFNNEDQVILRWPILHCFYYEISEDDDTYLLNGGKWYRVTKDFVAEVKEYISSIPIADIALPNYSDESEAAYNERVHLSDTNTFALMDRKIIPYGGGYSTFEFCDLYTVNKKIVHVKRYGQSSVLSHLFAQGVASARLFHTEQTFRELVNKKLPETHKIERIDEQPKNGEYEIVYAIISKSADNLELPFFSKIILRRAVRDLKGYGYRVSWIKIPFKALSS